jgi:hypothetical protein
MKNVEMSSQCSGTAETESAPKSLPTIPKLTEPNLNFTNGTWSKNRDSLAELESALDVELQNALSDFSDLVGISFDTTSLNGNRTSDSQNNVTSNANDVPKTDNLAVQIPFSQNGNHSTQHGASKREYPDYSPDGAEVDSAFSDSSSLPSSGSHVSMTTTSSQNSNGYGSGSSSASSGVATAGHMAAVSNHCKRVEIRKLDFFSLNITCYHSMFKTIPFKNGLVVSFTFFGPQITMVNIIE